MTFGEHDAQLATLPKTENRFGWVAFDMAAGAIFFWIPGIVIHWIRRNQFAGNDVAVLTVLLPATSWLGLLAMWKACRTSAKKQSKYILAILGIWLFGPLMMSISASSAGGGFAQSDGWRFVAIGTAFFPMVTFMMSTYDGTLGALFLATLILGIAAAVSSRKPSGDQHPTGI